uniref:(California timema) hypothetical protein n=1 Tax=Timema californicum TaxID=61474 RepID=A0A7R9IXC4_TIMCA|nr:unnamed protein product [Timema californicum]
MAEIVSISAGLVILLGIVLNFSLHKLEEGHVGVYYRVLNAAPFRLPPLTPANNTNVSFPPPPSPNFIKPMLLARVSPASRMNSFFGIWIEVTARFGTMGAKTLGSSSTGFGGCRLSPRNPVWRPSRDHRGVRQAIGHEEPKGCDERAEKVQRFEWLEDRKVHILTGLKKRKNGLNYKNKTARMDYED